MSKLCVFIAGNPAPQGSKRHVGNGVMVESSKHVKPWRSDIRSALLDDEGQPKVRFSGPVHLETEFVLPRPKSMPKKQTRVLSDKRPDMDKLLRAVLDAITSAGVWRDDAQWASGFPLKRIAEIGETAGLWLFITEAKPVTARMRERMAA